MKLSELRIRRILAGLRIVDVERDTGINRGRISEIERGDVQPKAAEIAKIERVISNAVKQERQQAGKIAGGVG